MSIFLKEMMGGQRRLTPDRVLEPRYTGKTIFTSKAPVPLVQRLAMVMFAAGGVATGFAIIGFLNRGTGFVSVVLRVLASLMIVLCSLVCILALFGVPPFQSKKLE